MKPIKFFAILVCFFSLFPVSNIFSQTDNGNQLLIKYWHYRNRLRYFVVNNENSDPNEKGIAMVAGIRNNNNSGWQYLTPEFISYGQQLSYMGYYIGVLATEYKLLNDANISNEAQLTLNELYRALLSIKRLDMCETGYPWGVAFGGTHTTNDWDGYLNRNDVPWNFIGPFESNGHSELNDELEPTNRDPTINPGYPTYVDKISSSDPYCDNILLMNSDLGTDNDWSFYAQGQPSRDELSKLFIGLALVKKCIPSSEDGILELNRLITKKIYLHIANNGFKIKNPDGDDVAAGADMWDFAWGFYGAVKFICSDNDITGNAPSSDLYIIWNNYQVFNPNSGIDHMTSSFAAIADNWVNPALLLTTGISVPSTGSGIKFISARHNWDTFYLTLWKFLNNKNEYNNIENDVYDQLIAAPCQGPYYFNNDLHSGNGWASSFKYQISDDQQNDGEGNDNGGNYAGLDYMLMYNLYLLEFGNTFYADLLNREITGSCPNRFIDPIHGDYPEIVYYNQENDAFKTLSSTQTISNLRDVWGVPEPVDGPYPHEYLGSEPWVGCVTYTAEKQIHLKPGFHVLAGATFHAYIRKQLCDLTSAPITSTTPYSTELWDIGGYLQNDTIAAEQNKSLRIVNNKTDSIAHNFNIFPNPFKDCFYFTNSTKENVNFEILDMSSKIIYSGKLNYENCYKELPSGVYFLKIYFAQGVKVIKLIKEQI